MHSTIAISVFRPIRSLRKSHAKTAEKTGLVVTSTTELATVVHLNDSIHDRKWMARKKPAMIDNPTTLLVTACR